MKQGDLKNTGLDRLCCCGRLRSILLALALEHHHNGSADDVNVNEFHRDEEFYKIALGIVYGIPSESSLRNRLDGIGTTMNQQILDGNIDMFLSCG